MRPLGSVAELRGDAGLIARVSDRLQLSSLWSLVEALSPVAGRLEPMLITLYPGGRSGKHPIPHSVEQFALIVEGEPTLTLGPDHHVLRAGDAVTLLPRELRRWENRTQAVAQIVIVSAR